MDFTKKVTLRTRNQFPPKSDIADVLAFVKEQKIPGELCVSLPGNGGVTSIDFIEREKKVKVEVPEA